MLPRYEAGRMARERGCWRILCVATPTERADRERGYDEMELELNAVFGQSDAK